MLKDRWLIWRCKRGHADALPAIYEAHKDVLLTVARGLLNDRAGAEDVVHDVFVRFAESAETFELTGSLRGFLVTCVSNLARDRLRAAQRHQQKVSEVEPLRGSDADPGKQVGGAEQATRVRSALAALPFEQRQTVVLHLISDMTFREIAQRQGVSINTVQGRYRYGLSKLRGLLNGETEE